MTEIYDLLYRLGASANYAGFFHTAYAVSLCVEHPERLLLVTKWVYPEVAKRYKSSWKAVERNIRTVSCIIWLEGRPLLEELARRHLEQKPRNAQMLAILASSLDTPPAAVHGLGEPVAAENRVPLAELQIGGNDGGSFVQSSLKRPEGAARRRPYGGAHSAREKLNAV